MQTELTVQHSRLTARASYALSTYFFTDYNRSNDRL